MIGYECNTHKRTAQKESCWVFIHADTHPLVAGKFNRFQPLLLEVEAPKRIEKMKIVVLECSVKFYTQVH